MSRKIFATIITAVMLFSTCITAFAGQWKSDAIGYWWEEDNGSNPVNTWQWIDADYDGIAECYYFDENGYCLIDTVTPDGCMVDANGAWIENGVPVTQQIQSASAQSQGRYNKYGLSYTIMDMASHTREENIAKYPVASMDGTYSVTFTNGCTIEYLPYEKYNYIRNSLSFPYDEFEYSDPSLTTAEEVGQHLAENGYAITRELGDIPLNTCYISPGNNYVLINAWDADDELATYITWTPGNPCLYLDYDYRTDR